MGADLSLWNTQPSGALNYAGPGVANLNGTSTVTLADSGSGAGAGVPSIFASGGKGDTADPCEGLSGFDYWGCKFGTFLGTYNNPKQGPAAGGCPGCNPSATTPAQDQASEAAYTALSTGLTKTVSDIFNNKSLWLLAGMILLFVIVVMVIRR